MVNGKITYSQKLKPAQVQRVLDALAIPYKDYTPNGEGWIQLDPDHFYKSVAKAGYHHMYLERPAINVLNGGYIDHFFNGYADKHNVPGQNDAHIKSYKGDLVDLVSIFKNGLNIDEQAIKEAISFIQGVIGTKPPELQPGQKFAKNVIADKQQNYVMVPNSLWQNSGLSASAKIVWMAIFERCGKGKHYSFAGMMKLSQDTGLSRSTIQLKIEELKRQGFLIETTNHSARSVRRYPVIKTE